MRCRFVILILLFLFTILFGPSTFAAGNLTAAITPATTVPLYLSNLTINKTAVTGGRGATGTVTLSSLAPAGGVTVALASNNSVATITTTCTVIAGATQAAFNVTTTAVSASTIATLSATYNR